MAPLPQYFRRLQRLLLRRGRTHHEAEDLIQEAFLRMQEYCERGGQVQKPEGFLVRTVLRLAINARRDEHRELYTTEQVEELTFLLDTQPTPDEVLAGDECLRRMNAALENAGRRTREIFLLHRVDGYSYAQIAQRTGLSISSIEKQIASALAALAEVNE